MKQVTDLLHKAAAALLLGLSLTASLASARTVLYEGFDYPAGEIDGSQTGGTGFADESWTTSGINPFAITTPTAPAAQAPTPNATSKTSCNSST